MKKLKVVGFLSFFVLNLALFSSGFIQLGCGGGTTNNTNSGWTTVSETSVVGSFSTVMTGFFDISFSPADSSIGFFVGNTGTVDKSVNGGTSSTSIDDLGTSSTCRAVVMSSSNHVWVACQDNGSGALNYGSGASIWHSSDGGTTWELQVNTDATWLARTGETRTGATQDRMNMFAFQTDNVTGVAVGGYGNNYNLIWTTTDGGAGTGSDWVESYLAQTTGTDDELHGVELKVAGDNSFLILAVGNGGVILRKVGTVSTDFTTTAGWTQITSGTTQNLLDVKCIDDSICMAVGGAGTCLRSTDAGASWSTVDCGTTNELGALDYVTGTTKIWAGGAAGTILYSSDAGVTWTEQTTDISTYPVQAIYMIDENTGYAACANSSSNTGALMKTTSGGQ